MADETIKPMSEPQGQPAGTAAPALDTGGFLHPERVVDELRLEPGVTVADFGCGSGYFSIPAARAVGEHGKVYAIDIQRQVTELVRAKAKLEGLLHVEPRWADLERPGGSGLPDGSVDFVIVANILFQAEARPTVLAEAARALKSGGRLAIIEWDETPFPAGPPPALRIPKDLARRLAAEAGFKPDREFSAGDHHFGLLFTKP